MYKKAKTIVLKKPGKKTANYAKVKAYKLIALSNIIKKVLETILAIKLRDLTEKYILFPCA